jgi:hypothetical protein
VSDRVRIVTADQFASVEEDGCRPLAADADGGAVLAESTEVMLYGDGGAGKTTLCVDLAFHLATGSDWLGVAIPEPVRVLLVENEGPRPLFRAKLRRKFESWSGPAPAERIAVWEEPWATLNLANEEHRAELAAVIAQADTDVVIVGPVTASGMLEAGTLQEARDFTSLLKHVRELAGRPVTFLLVHHENKAGKVSGAWEPIVDTLLHLQAQGHGRARLYLQKVRWSSALHGTSLNLLWADGDSFVTEDKPELDDETLADQILAAIGAAPGVSWSKVEKTIKGVGNDRKRAIRDGLFAAGLLVNVVKRDGSDVALKECPERQAARLYLADDPTIRHLRQGSGAVPAQAAPPLGADGHAGPAPCAPPYRGAGVGAAQTPPAEPPLTLAVEA